jgi:hypothetical protein
LRLQSPTKVVTLYAVKLGRDSVYTGLSPMVL